MLLCFHNKVNDTIVKLAYCVSGFRVSLVDDTKQKKKKKKTEHGAYRPVCKNKNGVSITLEIFMGTVDDNNIKREACAAQHGRGLRRVIANWIGNRRS